MGVRTLRLLYIRNAKGGVGWARGILMIRAVHSGARLER